jgi:hypothetical protein
MPNLTQADGKTFLTGIWERRIKGKKDGLRLQFFAGVKQADGAFLYEGKYDSETTSDNSKFSAFVCVITPPSTKIASVSVSIFQSKENTYAAAYCLQTDRNSRGQLTGSYLDVRGDGGAYQLNKIPSV